MSFESQYQHEETLKDNQALRNGAGIILILSGMFVGFWVFLQVYKLLTQPGEVMNFHKFIPIPLTAEFEGEKIFIPAEFLSAWVAIPLLLIAGSVAKTFVGGGVSLMQSSFQRVEKALIQRVETLELWVKDLSRKDQQ